MIVTYKKFSFDLKNPLDISSQLHTHNPQINCYYAPPFKTEPVVMGNFIGDIKQGGVVNYKNVFLNPHGNGTHTECVAHISNIETSIHKTLTQFHFLAQVISTSPEKNKGGDSIILKHVFEKNIQQDIEAIIIRTNPNSDEKLSHAYSGTNPPYLDAEVAVFLREKNIKHLLIDLPSIDREEDGGKLEAHKAFFHYPEKTRLDATITELIYVPDSIADGIYLLNLQIASFEIDVSPSKPVLFPQI